jgi:hypothetical protein
LTVSTGQSMPPGPGPHGLGREALFVVLRTSEVRAKIGPLLVCRGTEGTPAAVADT